MIRRIIPRAGYSSENNDCVDTMLFVENKGRAGSPSHFCSEFVLNKAILL